MDKNSLSAIVLDVGGTSIKYARFQSGTLRDQGEVPTQASLGGPHVLTRMSEVIHRLDPTQADCIGISTAGQVNPVTGTILYANQNIPGYTGARIRETIHALTGLPVAVENDVNAAAIGEAHFGAGRGEKDFVCLTYGTGVGGAIVLQGELYHGSSFSAGEFGSILTHPQDREPSRDMYSGGYEKYASTTALVEKARTLDPTLSDGRAIFARKEEPAVTALIDGWTDEITYGLITIVHMLNPSCLILGGGVMEQDFLIPLLTQKLMGNLMDSFRHVKVKKAALGNRAGLLGMAYLCQELASKEPCSQI